MVLGLGKLFFGLSPHLFSPVALYAQKHTQARTYTHEHEQINIQVYILLLNRAAHLQCVHKNLSITFTIEYLPHKHSAYISKCTYVRMYARMYAHAHICLQTQTQTHACTSNCFCKSKTSIILVGFL